MSNYTHLLIASIFSNKVSKFVFNNRLCYPFVSVSITWSTLDVQISAEESHIIISLCCLHFVWGKHRWYILYYTAQCIFKQYIIYIFQYIECVCTWNSRFSNVNTVVVVAFYRLHMCVGDVYNTLCVVCMVFTAKHAPSLRCTHDTAHARSVYVDATRRDQHTERRNITTTCCLCMCSFWVRFPRATHTQTKSLRWDCVVAANCEYRADTPNKLGSNHTLF